ncbi:hypothetical protein MMC11_001618 [Xylographa trunciseda]|nr:hypothetical protein [Xylographa trunciseda]
MDDLIEMFSDVDVAHPASNGEASNRPASFPVSQPICAEFEPSISTLHANPAPGRRSLTSQDNSPTYPLITVDHGNEASSSRLGDFFVVGEEPRVCYSDRELLDISRHLNLCGRQAWCRAPRLYTVLRIIGELKSLDAIIDQGISDIWFPFTASSVPTILSPSMRIKFIEAQPLVLTKAVDLEKDNRKNHTHFSRDETFPFEVRGKLGSGRYGTVDRVFSPFSRREFARKRFVRLKGTGSKDEIQSFKTELNILKKIRHPHCIELIASYTDTKYFGLIMSPVADCTLSSFYRLALEDLANANLLRGFYGCLANALGYLHDSKIRHRDIKPQNILVKGGIVLLADFGISLQWENLSRATTTEDSAKSWIYCAPEAAEYQARNCSSDIWSLGCVFLEMGTVLKGESIDAMRGFFQQRTGSYMFYQNISTIQEWSLLLQRQGSTCDNAPIEWALPMLHGSAQSRPHANELYAKISIFRQKTTAGTVVYAGTCCAADGGTDSAFDSAFDGDLWAEDRDDDIKSPPTTDDSLQPSTKAELVAETALRVRKDSDQSLANLLAVPSKDVEMEISIMVPSFLDSVKASNFPSTALIDNASLLGLAESSKRIQESDSQVDTKFDRAALATESEKLSLTSDIEATTRSISPIIADMTDSSSAKIPLVVPNTTSNAHCTESIDAARTYELTQTTQNSPIHFPCWCLAIGSFQGTSRSAEHLKFTMGDLVECLSAEDGVWWIGRLRHETGLVHSNSLQVLENISAPLITKAWPPFPTVGRLPWLDSQSWSTPSRFLRDVKADDAFMNIVKSRNADLYKLIELAAEKDIAALLQLLIGEGLDFKAKRVPEKKGRHSLIRGKRLGSKAKKVPEMKEDPPLLQVICWGDRFCAKGC